MVSPSATKTTISARLASEVWKRSISPLYGARAAPTQQPGDEDGQEARAVRDGRDAVDHAGDRRACGADRAPRRAARPAASAERATSRPGDADREPDRHLDRELADDGPEARVVVRGVARASRSSARSRPGRWRPTRPRGSCRCGRRSRAGRARRTSPRDRSARARLRGSPRSSSRSRRASARRAPSRPRSRTCRARRAR